MKNIVDILAKHQILICSAIIVFFTAALGGNYIKDSFGQGAALRSGSCTLQADVDARILLKKDLENKIANAPALIKEATDAVAANIKAIATAKSDSKKLQSKIKSDFTIQAEKRKVDTYAASVEKLKNSRTNPANLSSMERSLSSQLASYNMLVADNNANKDKIAALGAEAVRLEGLQASLDAKVVTVKKEIEDAKALLPTMDSYIKSAQSRLCDESDTPEEDEIVTASPEVCNDGKDNDLDSAVDCNDQDCEKNKFCIYVDHTYDKPEEVCNDKNDNDGDSAVDCEDPECAQDNFCKTMANDSDCPDSDHNGKSDSTGENCSLFGKKATSCAVCVYGDDMAGDCAVMKVNAQKQKTYDQFESVSINDVTGVNVFLEKCNDTTKSFYGFILEHSTCADNFERATAFSSQAVKALETWGAKWPNAANSIISVMDLGCHSLGGTYVEAKTGAANKSFSAAMTRAKLFQGTLILGGNQSFANHSIVDTLYNYPGFVTFAGKPSVSSEYDKLFAACPATGSESGSECRTHLPENGTEQERIKCGNAPVQTYFCAPGDAQDAEGYYKGVWKKSKTSI